MGPGRQCVSSAPSTVIRSRQPIAPGNTTSIESRRHSAHTGQRASGNGTGAHYPVG